MATTLSRLMKKVAASSSVIIPHRKHTTAILSAPLKTNTTDLSRQVFRTTSVPSHHGFSALSENRSILSLIECDLECAEEKSREVAKAAREFPFKIVDDEKNQYITLTREYHGEEIKVNVYLDTKENEEKRESRRITFTVTVSKKSGRTLGFGGDAEATDGITLNFLSVGNSNSDDRLDEFNYYTEPQFSKLFKNSKKGFHKYLEVRGIEPSFTKFLCDYMVQRKHMRCRALLKDLKTFLDN